jgi:hypothetical protein
MTKYTAQAATEYGIGGSVNGTGKRQKIEGAYTISPEGKRVRAFRKNEGGIEAAQKWADYCNEHLL